MNVKPILFAAAIAGTVLSSCGNGSTTAATGSKPATDAAASKPQPAAVTGIPTSAQTQKAYDAILAKAGVTDPEILEFTINYNKSGIGPEHNSADISVQMVSPKDKNKVLKYEYSIADGTVGDGDTVSLSSGIGSDEKFIDTYDGFKSYLFKKSDMIPFDKLDALYKAGIEKSTYKPDECYVSYMTAEKRNGSKLEQNIQVQSTRSITASKSMYFSNDGTFKK